jgi:hypothetical protein
MVVKGVTMNTQNHCQSCGMPINDPKMLGTESDGSAAESFCTYCYQQGKYTQDISMEEMIEICVPHLTKSGMGEQEARSLMASTLPKLSRWKQS